jgi:hypothetical protein
MSTRPPFDFNISAAAAKKRKTAGRRGMSGISEAADRPCDYPSCKEKGAFRAPKSPDLLDEFFWFCKDHIREYNLKWNFFQGTTDEEFQKFLDKNRVWERETKPFSRLGDGNAWARLGVNDPMSLLGEKATQNPGKSLSTATRKYKALVKDLHPDMNGGDRRDEERLQEVVWAWDQLKDSRYFRE